MTTGVPRLVVAAALVDDLTRPTRLLAARRSRPPALAGQWELPGGKIEPGEQPIEALHRELWEELRIRVDVGGELEPPRGTGWPVTAGFVMRVWWCVSDDLPTLSPGHDALRWVDRTEIDELPWLPGDLAVVDRLVRRLRSPTARVDRPG